MTESPTERARREGRNIVVVTGTDTEIGKTMVTCGIARGLADAGVDVRAIKPVESGIDELEEEQRDGVNLARAARQSDPSRALVELGRPLAPPEAADIDGVALDMDRWCRHILREAESADIVLVEGAGGLLSPLTWDATARDLAARLDANVLLVAPDALGVLNHTLLTLEALDAAGLPVVGTVFSRSTEGDESTDKNARTLERFTGRRSIAVLPKVSDWQEAADHLDEPIDWVRATVEA